ncbi:polysaccharide deacetylase family protein [Maribacter polysaccharolyticus]|uniref:polysaccharide deacetylase family protein n=1 Tax=Maribacter polysaccharolyticus TaxID=3020831 RepID=UPI00237FABF8|nr:polysaccharide deacetylase family protein [Maribacter polysaccharolyticus]MDE3741494.1 polysaccharide deacetylase family protein [Maribacter polysaccharolyticus]
MISRIKKYLRPKEPKAIVLMYHRVCTIKTDPWQLAVNPTNFETQIKALKNNFHVLPVSDLMQQFKDGKIKPKSIYITFDDAYRDNFTYAKPVLETHGCPATFFIPTHFVGQNELFWWDELESIFLHATKLPPNLTLSIGKKKYTFHFEGEPLNEEIRTKHQSWVWPAPPPTNRCKTYLELWELLKPLSLTEISGILEVIRKWADHTPSQGPENYPMNRGELENLAQNELFSLGIHTMTHPALAYHSTEFQTSEITGSKNFLAAMGFPQINAIAYPYGNHNDETLSVVKQNNIPLGFTTEEAVITRNSTPLRLGRIQVTNCSGPKLIEKLNYYFDL